MENTIVVFSYSNANRKGTGNLEITDFDIKELIELVDLVRDFIADAYNITDASIVILNVFKL